MGERELILFCVSLREISSDFNDSHSQELTLAKIKQVTGEREFNALKRITPFLSSSCLILVRCSVTVNTAATRKEPRRVHLRGFQFYGLFTVIDETTFAFAS